MNLKDYSPSIVSMYGIDVNFRLCHLPFLLTDDAYGVLALEGSSGTGKSTLSYRLGLLNQYSSGGKVRIYSADKAKYEDFVGIPFPAKDTEDMIIRPMPNSVATAETVIIDEFNRTRFENQEKWMALISSRLVDGHPTKCKYLFAAMNPIMGQKGDVYEGTQPLDKAMGERVLALLVMKPFHKMDKATQTNILKSSFNQVKWEPTDEAVRLHSEYLRVARNLYEDYKVDYFDHVSRYVIKLQEDLAKISRGGVVIEARRAQFFMLNILATHALNNAYSKCSLEVSAKTALSISFPGRTWEQPIEEAALRQAHEESKGYLIDLSTKHNTTHVEAGPLFDKIVEALEARNTEEISGIIHSGLPPKESSPIDHYIYARAVVKGFSKLDDTNNPIKREEMDRFRRINDHVERSTEFSAIRDECLKYSTNGGFPRDYKYPDYLEGDKSENNLMHYKGLAGSEISWYVQAAIAVNDLLLDYVTYEDFVLGADKLLDLESQFRSIADHILDPKKSILDSEFYSLDRVDL